MDDPASANGLSFSASDVFSISPPPPNIGVIARLRAHASLSRPPEAGLGETRRVLYVLHLSDLHRWPLLLRQVVVNPLCFLVPKGISSGLKR